MNTSRLTPRERQIADLIAQGKSNKEIAEVLGISQWTVGSHRKRLCGKFGVHTAAELIARCASEARAGPSAARRHGKVDCRLSVDLIKDNVLLHFDYSGRLRLTPGPVTVQIGRKMFYF